MKITHNQVDAYCEQIKQDLTEIYNDLKEANCPHEQYNRILKQIEEKTLKVKEYMNSVIDIGGIIQCLVKPKDIVKIEYDNGVTCYCFEVKEGRKKPKYYHCGNYIY